MKLNFRSIDGGGTLAHGVAPVIIPPPTGALSSRSTPPQRNVGVLDGDPSLSGIQNGAVPGSPRHRRFHLSFGTGMLCLLVIAVICVLPSILPAAVRHVERLVDWSRTISTNDASISSTEQSSSASAEKTNDTAGDVGSRAIVSSQEQRMEPLLAPRKKTNTYPSDLPSPVAASASSNDFVPNYPSKDVSPSNADFSQMGLPVRDHTKSTYNSFGVTEKGLLETRVMSASDRLEPMLDEWNKYVVVRHGNLYMSETFEARLNEEVAGKVFERHPEIFGHVQRDCGGRPDISFSFNTSPKIQAELEIVTQCGPEGSSCTLRPGIDDLRRLHVNVGSGQAGEHFLTADATRESERVTWGPLVGPLKVKLLEDSMLALKKTCPDPQGSSTRILSVDQLKMILREIARREGSLRLRGKQDGGYGMEGSRFDVFRYDAHPHHHIGQSLGSDRWEGRMGGQEERNNGGSVEGDRSRWKEGNVAKGVGNGSYDSNAFRSQREVGIEERRRELRTGRFDSARGQ